MKYYINTEKGFTLVETLVSVTILLFVIVGPMTIISSTSKSTSYSSEQIVAFFLAQEGAELIQKARDDLLIKYFLDPLDADYEPDPWGKFIDSSSAGEYKYCFSTGCGLGLVVGSANGSLMAPIECTGSNCKLNLNLSHSRIIYAHSSVGADDTVYTRVIKLSGAGDEIKVVSKVTWRTGSVREVQKVEVVTYLFDIYGL